MTHRSKWIKIFIIRLVETWTGAFQAIDFCRLDKVSGHMSHPEITIRFEVVLKICTNKRSNKLWLSFPYQCRSLRNKPGIIRGFIFLFLSSASPKIFLEISSKSRTPRKLNFKLRFFAINMNFWSFWLRSET